MNKMQENKSFMYVKEVALVLLLCSIVYWPRLGTWGFYFTEGHRAITAWEMMDTGDYLTPRMFEQAYLRKPPGLQWMIIASSMIFGQTEFAARAVSAFSASLMAIITMFFANRWFGRPWGLYAGSAQVLTPLFLGFARAVEIESLNNLFTQLSVFLLLDMLLNKSRQSLKHSIIMVFFISISITGLGLAKGPAGVPCLIGAVLSVCIVSRSASSLKRPALWTSFAVPALTLTVIGHLILSSLEVTGEPVVKEGVMFWHWSSTQWYMPLMLAPMTLVSALPTSLVLLFPLLRQLKTNESDSGNQPHELIARAIVFTSLLSLLIYAAVGISNTRYAMPAVTFIPVLVAYVMRNYRTGFSELQTKLAKYFLVHKPVLWVGILLSIAFVWITVLEPRHGRKSGREPGFELAKFIPDGAVILANGMIESHPELIFYARRFAAREGKNIRVMWKKTFPQKIPLQTIKRYFLLASGYEMEWYRENGFLDHLQPITSGKVRNASFTLLQVVNFADDANALLKTNTLEPSR